MASSKGIIPRLRSSLYHHGISRTSRKIFNRLFNPISEVYRYVSYLMEKENYAQNIIFIAAFSKSGSTWLENMFCALKGFSAYVPVHWARRRRHIPKDWKEARKTNDLHPEIFNRFKRRLAVIKGHTWGTPGNVKVLKQVGLKHLIMVRDPRDQLISEYWYVRNNPIHWEHQIALGKSLTEYITYKLETGLFAEAHLDWIKSWLENRDADTSLMIRYEDLLENTYDVLQKVFGFLTFDIADSEVKRIITDHSFKRKAARKRGSENIQKFVRKGVAGEWKEVYTPDQKERIAAAGEDVILRLGYEATV